MNTLDLLKKGTSPLAQRARAASRILEAQVGTNPRIRVQQDDAFVLWDKIAFKDPIVDNDKEKSVAPISPEWVRRTICCARWEMEQANKLDGGQNSDDYARRTPRMVFAVLASGSSQVANQVHQSKRSDGTSDISSPVPLPAPSPHANKHEPRTAGTLVQQWAARAAITMLEIQPSSPSVSTVQHQQVVNPRISSEDERPKRQFGRGRKGSHVSPGPGVGGGGGGSSGGGLVERPPAVMAMMEMVSQPSKVVRVLARGEKLDPES